MISKISSFFSSPSSFQSPPRRSGASRSRGSRRAVSLLASLVIWHGLCDLHSHAEPGRIEIGAKLAPSWENHAGERRFSENTFKQGISAGAGVRYGLLDAWSAQVELLYATRGTRVESDGELINEYSFQYVELPVLARFRRHIPVLARDGRFPLSGYLIVGPALSYLIGAQEQEGTRELPRDALRTVDVTVIAGIGAAWEITPQWAASFEIRYDRGFRDAFATGVESSNEAILLTLSIDRTINDRDGDGILNHNDSCRKNAEDRNGYKDTDGCPDALDDDDKDGLASSVDACPTEPEDEDGFEDTDGCPDPDNDGDGLADAEDKCPDKAFKYNRERDTRGCPPELQYVRMGSDRLEPPLLFERYESELTEDSRKILDEVAVLLTDYYPKMRLRLEGHADGDARRTRTNDEEEEDNQRESERRAQTAIAYLVKKGIDRERLVEKGFGNDSPISREETLEGKAKNRRVELIIIENPEPAMPPSP